MKKGENNQLLMVHRMIQQTSVIQRFMFSKIDQMVKIKKINKVYGRPLTMLVYLSYLGFKLTEQDQFDRKTYN